jgi:cell division transport system ATP-binding protein
MIELEQLAKYLGLHEFFNTPVKNLNGGSKQKVALLRALMSRPNILLLDEPTSALDIDNAQKVFELVRYFNEKFHMTIFWASHNRDMVRKFTGKNIHLEKGRIVYTGHACLI